MIVNTIGARLALPVYYLSRVARSASHRYKEYTIPKKTGGVRIIHHPARELKLVQNWLLQNVLTVLPVHGAATAYRQGSSIRQNAARHVSNNFLLRVDFRNFFPSIKGQDIAALLIANRSQFGNTGLTDDDITFIRQIVCRKQEDGSDALTIGAPTSPHLSNAVMFDFDHIWFERLKRIEVSYTRYADDLYLSTNQPDVLKHVLEDMRNFLHGEFRPRLTINDPKTAFSSRKRRRLAAGLVLTSDRKISIGRHKKRMIKAQVLKLKHGELQPAEVASLRGWISYLRSVEPSFVSALQQKYDLDFASAITWNR